MRPQRGSWGRGAAGVRRGVSLPGGPSVHAAPRLHGLSPYGGSSPLPQPAAAHPHSRGPAAGLTAEEKERKPRAPGHRISLSCSAATAMVEKGEPERKRATRRGRGQEVRRCGNGSALGRGMAEQGLPQGWCGVDGGL